mmetsp:Transcript_41736/g.50000  ORF Transcript_41736/g.50000 Transcript_41736/m.50000 type:complete len:912 (-) Transcript_41736:83-2818(-)|eukprot:CAMPEP_0194386074 /NCGR_PEP_ID=MMETSP0174-20130528/84306_1 /TAXON_ID=216777 /ORGANISM="Proboscia alata, Strain PI-D3" /LENGTH=911 /DNA_ID=CAMNT_0039174899 /DNA_START=182 /DNA_END=2917 /DNA_ORIENTATION=-
MRKQASSSTILALFLRSIQCLIISSSSDGAHYTDDNKSNFNNFDLFTNHNQQPREAQQTATSIKYYNDDFGCYDAYIKTKKLKKYKIDLWPTPLATLFPHDIEILHHVFDNVVSASFASAFTGKSEEHGYAKFIRMNSTLEMLNDSSATSRSNNNGDGETNAQILDLTSSSSSSNSTLLYLGSTTFYIPQCGASPKPHLFDAAYEQAVYMDLQFPLSTGLSNVVDDIINATFTKLRPTKSPTSTPTVSISPTFAPISTVSPTRYPTSKFPTTQIPTKALPTTFRPSTRLTVFPTTSPTFAPTVVTAQPTTLSPTGIPTTIYPTVQPTTFSPTKSRQNFHQTTFLPTNERGKSSSNDIINNAANDNEHEGANFFGTTLEEAMKEDEYNNSSENDQNANVDTILPSPPPHLDVESALFATDDEFSYHSGDPSRALLVGISVGCSLLLLSIIFVHRRRRLLHYRYDVNNNANNEEEHNDHDKNNDNKGQYETGIDATGEKSNMRTTMMQIMWTKRDSKRWDLTHRDDLTRQRNHSRQRVMEEALDTYWHHNNSEASNIINNDDNDNSGNEVITSPTIKNKMETHFLGNDGKDFDVESSASGWGDSSCSIFPPKSTGSSSIRSNASSSTDEMGAHQLAALDMYFGGNSGAMTSATQNSPPPMIKCGDAPSPSSPRTPKMFRNLSSIISNALSDQQKQLSVRTRWRSTSVDSAAALKIPPLSPAKYNPTSPSICRSLSGAAVDALFQPSPKRNILKTALPFRPNVAAASSNKQVHSPLHYGDETASVSQKSNSSSSRPSHYDVDSAWDFNDNTVESTHANLVLSSLQPTHQYQRQQLRHPTPLPALMPQRSNSSMTNSSTTEEGIDDWGPILMKEPRIITPPNKATDTTKEISTKETQNSRSIEFLDSNGNSLSMW